MNLNVIRTLTMRSKVEGAEESVATLGRIAHGHESVADAIAKNERQMIMALRSQQDFARANQMLSASNDNLGKSWRDAERDGMSFRRAAGTTHLSRELERLGMQGAVVTGMLHKTKDGFTILQNPANQAAGAVGQVTTNLNVMAAAADPASQSVSNFSKHLTLLGAAGVVTGVIIAIRSAMDDLFKTANRAQDTRLGSTELLALQAAATSARVPLSDLNSAIDKFTEVSKKAPDDAKEFYKSLSNINPALSEAFKSAGTQGERLRIIADGFAQSRNEVQKYQLALQTFNTDNDRTISIFDKGRAALDGYISRAQQFGIVVDDAFIAKAQEAQAKFNTLTTLIQQRLTIAVVEGTLAVSSYASSWGNVSSVVPGALGALDSLRSVIRDLSYDFSLLAKAWAEVMKPGAVTMDRVNAILEPIGLIFGVNDPGGLKRKFAVEGQNAGKAFSDSFYDAMRGTAANANVPLPTSDPRKTGTAAFGPRPHSNLRDATNATSDALDRQADSIKKRTATMIADTNAVGLGVQKQEEYRVKAQLLEAQTRSDIETVRLSTLSKEEQAKAIDLIAENAGKAAQGLALMQAQNQADFTSKTMFFSPEDLAVAQAMNQIWGNKWPKHTQDNLALQIKFNSQLGQARDFLADAFSGFSKDIANGVKPMDALLAQAKRLNDIFIDIAAKKVVNEAMGQVFGGLTENTGVVAGSTSASAILQTAGVAVGAAIVAGATEAAIILGSTIPPAAATLPVAGAATGVAIEAGAISGALALASAMAPLLILMAAVLAVAYVVQTIISESAAAVETQKRIVALRNRAILASTDTSTLGGALTQFDINANLERSALPNKGKTEQSWASFLTLGLFGDKGGRQSEESMALEKALGAERLRLIEDFGKKAVEAERQRLQALADLRMSFDDRVFDATTDTTTLDGEMLAFDRRAAQERLSIAREMAEALPDLERALSAERLQIADDFAKQAAQAAEQQAAQAAEQQAAIAARVQGFGDQLFAVLNDTTTLEGQLAAIDLQTRREREREVAEGGEALVQFDLFAMARRLKVVQDFGRQAVEAEQRAAEERQNAINGAARNVVDYINGLMGGASSTLSPQNRLASAQSSYNANLALAQGGNIDAQNKFTSLADNLEKAARDFYGSAAGYQDIRSQIIAQGLGLPAVGATTDPVVIAIRDALTAQLAAIHGTTTAIHGTTTAVGGTTHAVDDSGMRISSDLTVQTAVLDIINASTGATKLQAESIAASTAATNGLMSTVTSLLDAIRGFNQLTAAISGRLEVLGTNVRDGTFQNIIYLDKIREQTGNPIASIRLNTSRFWDSDSNNTVQFTSFATGGVIQPHGLALVSEHSPGGGRYLRAGSEPISVFPGSPAGANDNGAHFEALARTIVKASMAGTMAQVDVLREENAMLRAELRKLTAAVTGRGQGRRGTDVLAKVS